MSKKDQRTRLLTAAVAIAAVGSTGCYAKKKDMQSELMRVRQEFQQADQALEQRQTQALGDVQNRLSGVSGRLDAIEGEVQRLRTELGDLNVKVTRLNGLIAFAIPVHFEFDKADLRDADRAVLRRIGSVVKELYPTALITAEGFTDPAGPPVYNLRLGKKRADAVRTYLVSEGGFSGEQVRTVSYGESTNRLIDAKARGPGEAGMANRRVVLLLDYAGAAGLVSPIITN